MVDHQAAREKLEARREKLLARTGKIERDLRALANPDSQERVTERENDEVLEGLGEAERAELEQIRLALARLDAGTYFQCQRCGGEIPEARLEAVPETTYCVACA
ncbi:MAG: TraR/DksA family transcriptional regulator [Myxococcota bacterium]